MLFVSVGHMCPFTFPSTQGIEENGVTPHRVACEEAEAETEGVEHHIKCLVLGWTLRHGLPSLSLAEFAICGEEDIEH